MLSMLTDLLLHLLKTNLEIYQQVLLKVFKLLANLRMPNEVLAAIN